MNARESRERAAGMICAAVVLAACSDATAPAATERRAPPSITPRAEMGHKRVAAQPNSSYHQPRALAEVAIAVEDAVERLAASLEHAGSVVELRGSLRSLAKALSRSDREQSERLLKQAHRLLRGLGSRRDAPEV